MAVMVLMMSGWAPETFAGNVQQIGNGLSHLRGGAVAIKDGSHGDGRYAGFFGYRGGFDLPEIKETLDLVEVC